MGALGPAVEAVVAYTAPPFPPSTRVTHEHWGRQVYLSRVNVLQGDVQRFVHKPVPLPRGH